MLLIFIGQCKKDAPIILNLPANNYDCRQPDSTLIINPFGFTCLGGVQNYSPVFNPNNSNEFLYFENDTLGNGSLVIYNLLSKQKKYLLIHPTTSYESTVNWSKSNWIIFADYSDGQLYKIRPSGDSLTKLTNFGRYSFPVSRINQITGQDVVYASFVNANTPYQIKLDINGNILDSIAYKGFWKGSLSNCGYLACNDNSTPYASTITVRDITNQRNIFVYIPRDEGCFYSTLLSVIWYPSYNKCEELYFTYSYYGDIFKININEYKPVVVKQACWNGGYGVMSISPDGKKIITTKSHRYLNWNNCITFSTDLFIMDIDGSNEQKVFK